MKKITLENCSKFFKKWQYDDSPFKIVEFVSKID